MIDKDFIEKIQNRAEKVNLEKLPTEVNEMVAQMAVMLLLHKIGTLETEKIFEILAVFIMAAYETGVVNKPELNWKETE